MRRGRFALSISRCMGFGLLFLAFCPSSFGADGAEALGYAMTSPVWIPYVLLQDNLLTPAYFPGHPYALSENGYLDCSRFGWDNGNDPLLDTSHLKPWSVRLSVEEGHDFDTLNRVSGRLVIDTSIRVGLLTSWTAYTRTEGDPDETFVGDGYLTYRFAQAEWIGMYAGPGFRLRTDPHNTRAGFSFVYGADVFPIKPLVLSAQVDLGYLDRHYATHTRATLGIDMGRMELFGGYDYLQIGTVPRHGPMVGMRLWF